MVDAIVSVVLQQLTSRVFEETQEELRLVTGVKKEIEKLTSNFRAIQAVLLDAERRQMKKDKAVGYWLDRLKDVSYDMDDILDEWRTAALKLQSEEADQNALVAQKKVCFLSCSLRSCFKQVCLRRDIALKIKDVNRKLDGIAKERHMHNLDVGRNTAEELPRLRSTAFVDMSEVRGREIEKSDLVSKLLTKSHDEGEGLQIISIAGMGGIGKTTLAQLAYNDKEIINEFETRVWVCVSELFDEIRIAKAIIEALEGKATDLVELQSLLVHIQNSIAMKKFFLVLDDIWMEDENKWKSLRSSLNNGVRGSRIVVTTRKEKVARMIKSIDVINVGKLSEEESWLLFEQLAFCDRSLEDRKKLEKYGRKIVGKCKGLPLAVNTVGSLLRFKRMEQQWQRILDSEMWNLEELEEGVFAPLLLSYNDLSSIVKQCFSYCAIFPKDYIMDKDDLIRLWMAQGYLASNQNTEMEIVGEECFDNLAMHSFFQEFKKDEDGNIISCKMHDIVHDFAQYIAKNECLTVEPNSGDTSSRNLSFETARHLRLTVTVESEASFSFKKCSVLKLCSLFLLCKGHEKDILKLRSLFLLCEGHEKDILPTSDLLPSLFKRLLCLRALTLDRNLIGKIPKEIDRLIHLRYLNFSSLEIKELPETLCDLYNLETLNIRNCCLLEKLPQGIGKLINLRHLLNYRTLRLCYMPKGIERLTCLQTLDEVVFGNDSDGSRVCTFESLKKLNHLRGSLKIRGLGNVKNEDEVKKAEFKNKNRLTKLELNFDDTGEASSSSSTEEMRNDAAVLEALQGPPNLERLEIQRYNGITMSLDWTVSLTQLKELSLNHCIDCDHLPPLGRLPSLKSLDIEGMGGLTSVSNEFLGTSSSSIVAFPKLIRLSFKDMPRWEDWDYKTARAEEQDMIIMPSLSVLEINRCFKLKGLPDHLVNAASHTLQIFVDGQSTLLKKAQMPFGLPPIQLLHQRLHCQRLHRQQLHQSSSHTCTNDSGDNSVKETC